MERLQGRITRAKVVDVDLKAARVELVEHYESAFQIVDYHALCYLKGQALRQHTTFAPK